MEFTQVIHLEIKKQGEYIVCNDNSALNIVLGTQAAMGNKHIYKIEKKGRDFYVPLEIVKKRIQCLEDRKQRLEEYLKVMKQVIK